MKEVQYIILIADNIIIICYFFLSDFELFSHEQYIYI